MPANDLSDDIHISNHVTANSAPSSCILDLHTAAAYITTSTIAFTRHTRSELKTAVGLGRDGLQNFASTRRPPASAPVIFCKVKKVNVPQEEVWARYSSLCKLTSVSILHSWAFPSNAACALWPKHAEIEIGYRETTLPLFHSHLPLLPICSVQFLQHTPRSS